MWCGRKHSPDEECSVCKTPRVESKTKVESPVQRENQTPEHDKRSLRFDDEIVCSYGYVELVAQTADDKKALMWHGWALREAFLAGISHQKKVNEAK